MVRIIEVHTAGVCSQWPGPGGFAAIVKSEDYREMVRSGGDPKTTVRRMELNAAAEGLRAAIEMSGSEQTLIQVRSASEYVTDPFHKNWVPCWGDNVNFPIENNDLWHEVLSQVEGREVSWRLINEQSQSQMDERCRQLAGLQSERAITRSEDWLETAESWSITGEPSPVHKTADTPGNSGAGTAPESPAIQCCADREMAYSDRDANGETPLLLCLECARDTALEYMVERGSFIPVC